MPTKREILESLDSEDRNVSKEDAAILRQMSEKRDKVIDKVFADTQANGDWDNFFFVIGDTKYKNHYYEYYLKKYYDVIPETEKYDLVKGLYVARENVDNVFRPFIEDIKKLRPAEYDKEILKDLLNQPDKDGNILHVYHGTTSAERNPAHAISWTIDYKTALFFAFRFPWHRKTAHVYMGSININDIIAYTNDRKEFEIIQLDSVSNVQEM